MRRKDREINDFGTIINILGEIKECCLSMVDCGKPYMAVMNFGYEVIDGILTLYFHSAIQGRKIDILKQNPEVYFEAYDCHGVIKGKEGVPCAYSCSYSSVAGNGIVDFITDEGEKTRALNLILNHVAGVREYYGFPSDALRKTSVFKVSVKDFTAKQNV